MGALKSVYGCVEIHSLGGLQGMGASKSRSLLGMYGCLESAQFFGFARIDSRESRCESPVPLSATILWVSVHGCTGLAAGPVVGTTTKILTRVSGFTPRSSQALMKLTHLRAVGNLPAQFRYVENLHEVSFPTDTDTYYASSGPIFLAIA